MARGPQIGGRIIFISSEERLSHSGGDDSLRPMTKAAANRGPRAALAERNGPEPRSRVNTILPGPTRLGAGVGATSWAKMGRRRGQDPPPKWRQEFFSDGTAPTVAAQEIRSAEKKWRRW